MALPLTLTHLWWSVAALVACGALRIVNLLALPVFSDETRYIRAGQVVSFAPAAHAFDGLRDGYPPLFTWLEALAMRVGMGDPVFLGRLTAALMGTATCLLVMACAAELGGDLLIPIAGWAYALCPLAVLNDRMALLDGPMAAWGALALWLTLRLARPAWAIKESRASIVLLCLLGAAIGCALLTKITAVAYEFFPFTLALLASSWPERLRRFAIPAVISVALFLVAALAPRGHDLVVAAQQQVVTHDFAATRALLSTLRTQATSFGVWMALYLTPPGVVLLLAGILGAFRDEVAAGWRILALWFLCVAVLYTALPQTAYVSHDVAFLAAPAALLCAGALHAAWRGLTRANALLYVTAILLLVAVAPAAAQDALLAGMPTRAILAPSDTAAYVQGRSSGYGLPETIAFLRRAARARPITIGCSTLNPPADALFAEFALTPGVTVIPFRLGDTRKDLAFARAHPGAYLVANREGNIAGLDRTLRPVAIPLAHYWKPGRRAAYVIYRVHLAPVRPAARHRHPASTRTAHRVATRHSAPRGGRRTRHVTRRAARTVKGRGVGIDAVRIVPTNWVHTGVAARRLPLRDEPSYADTQQSRHPTNERRGVD